MNRGLFAENSVHKKGRHRHVFFRSDKKVGNTHGRRPIFCQKLRRSQKRAVNFGFIAQDLRSAKIRVLTVKNGFGFFG